MQNKSKLMQDLEDIKNQIEKDLTAVFPLAKLERYEETALEINFRQEAYMRENKLISGE